MNNDFNVKNPSKENIDHAFKNLVYYLVSATNLDLYEKQRERFKKTLNKVNKILSVYINKNLLSLIDEKDLQDIKYELIDLDVETQNLKSYFAEWSLVWLDAIISLRVSEIKDINNDK